MTIVTIKTVKMKSFVEYFDLILNEKLEVNRHVIVEKLKSINEK